MDVLEEIFATDGTSIGSVRKNLEWTVSIHVGRFLEFLAYIKDHIDNDDDREKIIEKIDEFLEHPYWKKYFNYDKWDG